MESRITLDDYERRMLIKYLAILLESKELDKYEDGIKIYGGIEKFIDELKAIEKIRFN